MENEELLLKIKQCVESGKVNKQSPFPPALRGLDGADEYTGCAISRGIHPTEILNKALIPAMDKVGNDFTEKKIFVPQMLISAKAMNTALEHLKPFFESGEVQRKGKFIIGTVAGDLHDIGKNLVAMIVKGAGWEVIDLGIDVSAKKFMENIGQHPGAVVGLSALLTTTMLNMKTIVKEIKENSPETILLIGGAPVNEQFKTEIKADFYASGPQEAVSCLNTLSI